MKFSSGIDILQKENNMLRTTTKSLLVMCAALIGLVFGFYDKPPVMVERSSRGLEIVSQSPFQRSEDDLKIAIGLMMKARFDTEALSSGLFLNQKQMLLRENEQKELKSRSMRQNVVVGKINLTREEAVVDLDRVIAVGEIRSALKTKLKVTFEEIAPNELNPYGLLLSLADPMDNAREEKK